MSPEFRSLQQRVKSFELRIRALASLRTTASLPADREIAAQQWQIIEHHLQAAEARLADTVRSAATTYLPQLPDPAAARSLNAILGNVELDLARTFVLFDTYLDVLTQRHAPELGRLLAGCDALAHDAINREHPALSSAARPLVYSDRGFGASVLRESVRLPDGTPNPLPLIQIPYTRLKRKYNLTSIVHEAGHEAMARLALTDTLPKVLRQALSQVGAPEMLRELYALWAFEIGPDFWAFCGSGLAAAGGIQEVLALPPERAFRVAWTDPHPPPYLRTLLSFELCRQVWGRGIWDNWEAEWRVLYRLRDVPAENRDLMQTATTHVPVVAKALLGARFGVLNGRTLPDLFDLDSLRPDRLERRLDGANGMRVDLKGLQPCGQLAVFRLMKERELLSELDLDRLMDRWLTNLGQHRPSA